jgi:pentatricopeptide repeat protein
VGLQVAFTTLIKGCAESRDGGRALEILARMREQRVELDYLGYIKVREGHFERRFSFDVLWLLYER